MTDPDDAILKALRTAVDVLHANQPGNLFSHHNRNYLATMQHAESMEDAYQRQRQEQWRQDYGDTPSDELEAT